MLVNEKKFNKEKAKLERKLTYAGLKQDQDMILALSKQVTVLVDKYFVATEDAPRKKIYISFDGKSTSITIKEGNFPKMTDEERIDEAIKMGEKEDGVGEVFKEFSLDK